MFDVTSDIIEPSRVTRYCLKRGPTSLTFSEVLDLWQSNSDFRAFFSQILADSPFAAYRWETPPLTVGNASQPFQFVLLNSPQIASRKTDKDTYHRYFTTDEADVGVVSFANLSGDAQLVVPSPRTDISAYGHLATFIRNAPNKQVDAFWRIVSQAVKSSIGDTPIWLNTAGGGVAWLHVRLDARPKYYGYVPYETA